MYFGNIAGDVVAYSQHKASSYTFQG